jgi:hypothetical protein
MGHLTGASALLLAAGRFWKREQGWEEGQRRKLTSLGACLRSSRLARWVLGTLIAATIFSLRSDASRRRGEEQQAGRGGGGYLRIQHRTTKP